jgi:hypothetical protein
MMQFYFREEKADLLHLYYAVTDKQLEYISNHQYKVFPPRFFTKAFFCPMLNKGYAFRVASERTNWMEDATGSVHVLRFLIRAEFIQRYAQGSIKNDRTRIVVPKNELKNLNGQIVGYIERVEKVDLT